NQKWSLKQLIKSVVFRPKTHTKTFSYDGLPIMRLELNPPREESTCWSDEIIENRGEEEISHFDITYTASGEVNAAVKLYTNVGYTNEFKAAVTWINKLITRKEV